LGLPLANSPLQPLSDTEDETLHHVLSVTTHNAKYISLGKGVVTAVTTSEVARRSPHQKVILRQHLSTLSTHGLLRRKGERKGWLVEDWLIAQMEKRDCR
jgi:DNA-binding IscR family transcriptional regulator